MGARAVLGILLLAILQVVMAAGKVRAEEAPVLLADVNRTPAAPSEASTAEPGNFFRLGDRLLFSTLSSRDGSRDDGILWSTDGTAGGTRAVSSSLCPVPCGGITPLAVWHGLGLLETISGYVRLWRTDGTAAGTFPLTGVLVNTPGSRESLKVVSSPESGAFYFSGCLRASYRCVLWRSDGTRAGTSIFHDARGATFYDPHSLTFWRGRLYFVAYGGGEATGLWSTDGTPEGTVLVTAVGEDYDRFSVLQATSSLLFFGSGLGSGEAGEDLWVTDGTPEGTRHLADFDPSQCYPRPDSYCDPSDLSSMFTVGEKVYFITRRQSHGVELWSSDGTGSGTRPLVEMATGSNLGKPLRFDQHWLFPVSLARGQPAFLWTADDGFTRREPLNGCAGGVCPEFLGFLHPAGSGAWLFAGRDAAHGDEIWITDGTGAGTYLLADTCPGACSGYSQYTPISRVFGSLAGSTYFSALSNPEATDELWVTDGTPAGTHRVAGHASDLGFLENLAVFGTGGDGYTRSEIWITDGTAAGSRPVTALRTLAPGSNPSIHSLRDRAVFLADEGGHQTLWTSDGRPEGTSRFFDFEPETRRYVSGQLWIQAGGLLFFQAEIENERRRRIEIWRTDGTAQGTGRVAVLPRDTWIEIPVAWNGKLLFKATSSTRCSFWSSDGTATGTREILPPEPGRRCPTAVQSLGSRFVFVARVQGPDGFVPQIFVSDGTPEGTRQISRIRSYREPLEFDHPVLVGGTVFFRIYSPRQYRAAEVWRTDGTPEGTYRAFKLREPAHLYGFRGSLYLTAYLPYSFFGRGLFRVPLRGGAPVLLALAGFYEDSPGVFRDAGFAPLGDRLLFIAQDRAHGYELWVTDGAPEGTRLLRDIQPGPKSSEPAGFVRAGDRVFFTAEDGEHGRELWASDGTPEGTRLVWDLNPGGFSSLPAFLTVAGDHLFFSADDGEAGVEPWSLLLRRSAQ